MARRMNARLDVEESKIVGILESKLMSYNTPGNVSTHTISSKPHWNQSYSYELQTTPHEATSNINVSPSERLLLNLSMIYPPDGPTVDGGQFTQFSDERDIINGFMGSLGGTKKAPRISVHIF